MLRRLVFVLALLAVGSAPASAVPILLDFEGIAELDAVGSFYPEATFVNATVWTAGSNLNELDFPPHSGVNSAIDEGGPMTITFATPVQGFGGYFTYIAPLTLSAYDASNTLLGSVMSAFSSNIASDPTSIPNEFLSLFSLAGIKYVEIAGDPGGTSFFIDDATLTPFDTAVPVPEPTTISLLGGGLVWLVRKKHRARRVDIASRQD